MESLQTISHILTWFLIGWIILSLGSIGHGPGRSIPDQELVEIGGELQWLDKERLPVIITPIKTPDGQLVLLRSPAY